MLTWSEPLEIKWISPAKKTLFLFFQNNRIKKPHFDPRLGLTYVRSCFVIDGVKMILIINMVSAVVFLLSSKAFAYPDFISYGYKACMTCHYTGGGGGALNDYGKAVFASELTARTFTDKTPDEMGESSGFLGSKELPWWIRPGVKYRGLWFRRNVWDSNKTDRLYQCSLISTWFLI